MEGEVGGGEEGGEGRGETARTHQGLSVISFRIFCVRHSYENQWSIESSLWASLKTYMDSTGLLRDKSVNMTNLFVSPPHWKEFSDGRRLSVRSPIRVSNWRRCFRPWPASCPAGITTQTWPTSTCWSSDGWPPSSSGGRGARGRGQRRGQAYSISFSLQGTRFVVFVKIWLQQSPKWENECYTLGVGCAAEWKLYKWHVEWHRCIHCNI